MKSFLLLLLGLFALVVRAESRPNIIFIMADDHAPEAISCYGSWLKGHALTPNIDRIAHEGMRFDNTVNNNSICSPSRASILTGQFSHKNGTRGLNMGINPASPWFTTELQKAGYQTWAVGKWHLGTDPKGCDKFQVTRGQGSYFNPKFHNEKGEDINMTGYSSDVYTDVALDWLEKRRKDEPFCLLLHFKAPHHPYDYAERYNDLLRGVVVPEPETLYEDVTKTGSALKASYIGGGSKFALFKEGGESYYTRHKRDKYPSEMWKHKEDSRDDKIRVAYQHMIHKYIRCITGNDDNVGRVLKFLDENDLAENTVIIYTADQGYWLGQHGFYDKRLILEGSVSMPLVIRYPKLIKAGSVNNDITINVDFAPTLLDLAGVSIPETMQGRSLKPLLSGKTPSDWRSSSYYRYYASPSHAGVRTNRYTLAILKDGTNELFDREKDPLQLKNVATNPEYKGIVEQLQADFKRLETEVDYEGHIFPNAPDMKVKKRKKGKKKK